ncbi:MAG: undecaprenyl diphosphate synthase [Flavobacteriaceae bacterium]|jgi:undecaprenyl diphosphate synthase|tara:strand:- start:2390 stop:3115 length:726 start_codon:yes stop_codon:yes gene_type:complete
MKIEKKIPKHIAIIMDGNGRWAKNKGLSRDYGHKEGKESAKEMVRSCAKLGVKNLTLFAFSSENWKRPKLEVDLLMGLLHNSLRTELKELKKNNIKLETIGDLSKIPLIVRKFLKKVCEETKDNDLMTLTLALSYGSRDEIINSVKEIADKVKNNIISVEKIDESLINQHLYTRNLPDVDLMIRTSGEKRISNFLLWQSAYAELYFSDELWPDFKSEHLIKAISDYQNRERRFGRTSEQII